MRQHSNLAKDTAEKVVKDIRRATRMQYSAEEKIRIVLEGLRGEDSIAELCRREGIAQNLYYRWSKDFLEAGKKRLSGDTARAATSDEVKDLRREATALKEVVADLTLENRLLKKRENRALASNAQEPHPARELLSARRSRSSDRCIRRVLAPPALSREHRQSHPGRRLLRARSNHPACLRKDLSQDHPKLQMLSPQTKGVTSTKI